MRPQRLDPAPQPPDLPPPGGRTTPSPFRWPGRGGFRTRSSAWRHHGRLPAAGLDHVREKRSTGRTVL